MKQLQNELGTDAKILSEKVLHETMEHGKVKLNLYISVEENIVKHEPIDQGD
ncbi:sporulation protein YqfD [Oceanobacillus massiliensis]|uniref:sporulation protein YqfD n=1 Tax=Oceanobacillus massiliensis TaxID=1465765 RepID=UPI003019DD36